MKLLLTPHENTPDVWQANTAGQLTHHQVHLVSNLAAPAPVPVRRPRVETATQMLLSVTAACLILTGVLALRDPAALETGIVGTLVLVGLFGAYRLLVGGWPSRLVLASTAVPVICRIEGSIERVWWPDGDGNAYAISLGGSVWPVSRALWDSLDESRPHIVHYLLQGGALLSVQPEVTPNTGHTMPSDTSV